MNLISPFCTGRKEQARNELSLHGERNSLSVLHPGYHIFLFLADDLEAASTDGDIVIEKHLRAIELAFSLLSCSSSSSEGRVVFVKIN